ncbi:MAG: hypothetical protein KBT68_12690, partial [bacterium]|nr:hypothetical protein [Candidatus Colisoma equi]
AAGEGFALDISSMSFAFDTPDAGSGKTVTAAGYADSAVVPLGGTLASNYAFTFVPTTTAAITKGTELGLTGRLRWKYQQADNSFWAALDVTCTNGDPTALRDLCYVYEDRADCYLRNPTPMSTRKLSDTSSETYGGRTFGKAVLSDLAKSLRAAPLNMTIRYGVSDATLASSNDRVQTLAEMRVALYRRDRINLIKATEELKKSLGYLTWRENGSETLCWCPLAEGLPPLPGNANSFLGALPTVSRFNAAVGYGLPPSTLDSDPSLSIDEFSVSGGRIRGRVVMVSGNMRGIPGPNARLKVLGSATVSGPYVAVGTPELDGEGRFSMNVPVGVAFFKVCLSLVDVVK